MRNLVRRALSAMCGLLILFSPLASAQVAPAPLVSPYANNLQAYDSHATAMPGAGTVADLNGINQQNQERVNQAQVDLQNAQMALQNCANQEAQARANQAGQRADQQGQVMQQIAQGGMSSAGQLIQGIAENGAKTKISGAVLSAQVKTQMTNFNNNYGGLTWLRQSGTSVLFNRGPARNYCEQYEQSGIQPMQPGAKNDDGSEASAPKGFEIVHDEQRYYMLKQSWDMKVQNCVSNITQEGQALASDLSRKLEQASLDTQGGNALTGSTIQAATTAIGTAIGAGLQMHTMSSQNGSQDKIRKMDRQLCEQQAQAQIAQANRNLVQATQRQSQDLVQAALAQQLDQQMNSGVAVKPAATGSLGSVGDSGSLKPSSTPTLASASSPGAAAAAPKNGGGGAGAGGGAGGGDSLPWSFGGGRDTAPLGNGLPQQPESASYVAEGGGGGGSGGGFAGSGAGDGLGFGPAAAASGAQMTETGELALGDGGLNVLMSRARVRYAAHAVELVKSLDLKRLAAQARMNLTSNKKLLPLPKRAKRRGAKSPRRPAALRNLQL